MHRINTRMKSTPRRAVGEIVPILLAVVVVFLLAAAGCGKGTKSSDGGGVSTPRGTAVSQRRASLDVTGFPAKIAKDEKVSLKIKMKNTSSASISYAEISNSTYGFELWQKMKDGNEWVLESQSYIYFRDLPDPRKLQVQDFGVINPGETKEITFTLRELNAYDTVPNSFWPVLGKDRSGTYYAEFTGSKIFTCGTDTFRIEFGKVKNLHANPRGLMLTDLFDDPALSNEFTMDTTALHTCL